MPNAKRQTPNLFKPANVTKTNDQDFKNIGRAEGGCIHPLAKLTGVNNPVHATEIKGSKWVRQWPIN